MRALHFLETQVFTNVKAQTVAVLPIEKQQDLTKLTEAYLHTMTQDIEVNKADDEELVVKATAERPTLKQWLPENIELTNALAKLKYEIDLAASTLNSGRD